MRNEVAEHVDVGLVEHLSIPITVAGQALDTEAALHRALEPDLRLEFALQQLAIVAMGDVEVRSEEHTSELQSLMRISYAVFCLKKKKRQPKPQVIKYNKEYC